MNGGIRRVGLLVIALFVVIAAQLTYLQVTRSDQLANASGNPRKFLRDISRDRGPIVSSDGAILAQSAPSDDEYKHQRVYPADTAELFAHIVGYQSIQFGSVGVENAYSSDLAGRNFKVDLGNIADAFAKKQPTGTVVLTASKAIQQVAANALNGQAGAVVVLDVETGAIVAAYSNPTFNPNLLVGHDTKQAERNRVLMLLDSRNPLLARAWRELYPPGSTFKTVTAAIANENNVDTTKIFPTVNHIILPQTNNVPLFNFGGETCGGTLLEGFIVSCNTTYGQVGLDLGETFASGLPNFGVQTAPPNEDGSGIDPLIVPSIGPKPGTFQQNQPTFAQAAIGQNATAVTPLEMALVAESVATGGTILKPHVVDCVIYPNNQINRVPVQTYKRAMSPATAATMKSFMLAVVNDPRGTGTAAQIPGVQVAGKTGTAETAPGQKPHAWFIAFAPADQPRYAIAVLVEHGGTNGAGAESATGGRVAAPIAKQVLQALLSTPQPPSRCGSSQPGNATNGG